MAVRTLLTSKEIALPLLQLLSDERERSLRDIVDELADDFSLAENS